MKNKITSLLFLAGTIALVVRWTIFGDEAAGNLAAFSIWMMAILSFLALLFSVHPSVKGKAKRHGWVMSYAWTVGTGAIIGMLAMHAHFLLATIFLVGFVFASLARAIASESDEKKVGEPA